MIITTTNSDGEKFETEVSELPKDVITSGYIQTEEEDFASAETIAAIQKNITKDIENNSAPKLNRAQRRSLAKKAGKKGRSQLATISETAKKLNYIELIQKLRKLNEEKEKSNNEDLAKDC